MKVSIEVKDRREAEAVRRAMADPATRALVLIVGALLELPTDSARVRCLNYVQDKIADDGRR